MNYCMDMSGDLAPVSARRLQLRTIAFADAVEAALSCHPDTLCDEFDSLRRIGLHVVTTKTPVFASVVVVFFLVSVPCMVGRVMVMRL